MKREPSIVLNIMRSLAAFSPCVNVPWQPNEGKTTQRIKNFANDSTCELRKDICGLLFFSFPFFFHTLRLLYCVCVCGKKKKKKRFLLVRSLFRTMLFNITRVLLKTSEVVFLVSVSSERASFTRRTEIREKIHHARQNIYCKVGATEVALSREREG